MNTEADWSTIQFSIAGDLKLKTDFDCRSSTTTAIALRCEEALDLDSGTLGTATKSNDGFDVTFSFTENGTARTITIPFIATFDGIRFYPREKDGRLTVVRNGRKTTYQILKNTAFLEVPRDEDRSHAHELEDRKVPIPSERQK